MRLAVSNIAWRPTDADACYAALAERGVHGLEIAPGLLFSAEPDPFRPSDEALAAVREKLEGAGLELVSMQSLLFGVDGAALFGDLAERQRFAAGMRRAIDLASLVGVSNLVVGSPKNRVIPPGLDSAVARGWAVDTFRLLGDEAAAQGCKLAMEPNPAIYGTNFLNTIEETLEFVAAVEHPAVTINFDVGSLHLNGEYDRVGPLFALARDYVSHVHVSEPHLAPVPDREDTLERLFAALHAGGWRGWVSIEMRDTGDGSLANVSRAVDRCLDAMKATERKP